MKTENRRVTLFKDSVNAAAKRLDDIQLGKLFRCIISYINDEPYEPGDEIVLCKFDLLESQFRREEKTRAEISSVRSMLGKMGVEARRKKAEHPQKDITIQPSTEPTIQSAEFNFDQEEQDKQLDEQPIVYEPTKQKLPIGHKAMPVGTSAVLQGKKVYRRSDNKWFVAPTLEEVQSYCKEKGYDIDAQYFIDYNDGRNWCRQYGNKQVPIVNWRSTLSTFNQLQKKYGAAKGSGKTDFVHMDVNAQEYEQPFN